jgi:hypothetical protein
MRAFLVSESIRIPGQEYLNPSEPNRSGIRFRSELQSSGYKQQRFKIYFAESLQI